MKIRPVYLFIAGILSVVIFFVYPRGASVNYKPYSCIGPHVLGFECPLLEEEMSVLEYISRSHQQHSSVYNKKHADFLNQNSFRSVTYDHTSVSIAVAAAATAGLFTIAFLLLSKMIPLKLKHPKL